MSHTKIITIFVYFVNPVGEIEARARDDANHTAVGERLKSNIRTSIFAFCHVTRGDQWLLIIDCVARPIGYSDT